MAMHWSLQLIVVVVVVLDVVLVELVLVELLVVVVCPPIAVVVVVLAPVPLVLELLHAAIRLKGTSRRKTAGKVRDMGRILSGAPKNEAGALCTASIREIPPGASVIGTTGWGEWGW